MCRALTDLAHQPTGSLVCAASHTETKVTPMMKLVKSRAEEQFAATQKKDNLARKYKDKASQERAKHVASLKALRLAKEVDDKIAAEKAAAEKAAAKNKKSSRLPQAHRR